MVKRFKNLASSVTRVVCEAFGLGEIILGRVYCMSKGVWRLGIVKNTEGSVYREEKSRQKDRRERESKTVEYFKEN